MKLLTILTVLSCALISAAIPTPTASGPLLSPLLPVVTPKPKVTIAPRQDSCTYCLFGSGGMLTATACDSALAYPTCFPADANANQPIDATRVNCLYAPGLPYCVSKAVDLWASSAYYTDGITCGGVPETTLTEGSIPMPTECM